MGALDLIVPGAGAVAGIGQTIYGAVKAGQERKRMRDYMTKRRADNESFYNQNYHSDYTQRADTQALMKNLRDNLKRNNDVTANRAVVTGATPEAQLAAKEQSNKIVTDTTSRIAAQGQAYKDNIQNQYMNQENNLAKQEYAAMNGTALSNENVMGNGIKQVGNAAGSFYDFIKK